VVLSVLTASGAATALTTTTRRVADDARTAARGALFWSICMARGRGEESGASEACVYIYARARRVLMDDEAGSMRVQ
jgi:hypothetical protein